MLLTFFALTWIPFFWKNDVWLDKKAFANEYYKTVVDIGKIFFGFWLANIFLKKTQMKEFTQRIQQQWQEKIKCLHQTIIVLESVPNNVDINVTELSGKIRDTDINLCYLSELISAQTDRDKLGSLGDIAFEYKEEIHNHIKELLASLEKGEIICLRPFNSEIIENMTPLQKGHSEMIDRHIYGFN